MTKKLNTQLEIGTKVYHPCSMDIIESKVVGITLKEDITIYEIKSTDSIGACDRITSKIVENKDGHLVFLELETECEYALGLQDFVEGYYYTDKNEAIIQFYNIQKTLVYAKVENLKRDLKIAEESYKKVCNIIKIAKESINKGDGNN